MAEKDYSKGKIYMVFSPSTNLKYIGSTIDTLNSRQSKHRYDYINDLNCSSKIVLKVGDAEIILIHLYPCGSLVELTKEEGRVMDLYPDRVNKKNEGKTKREQADIQNKKRREDEDYKKKQAENRRNISQEQRNKENKGRLIENMTEEKANHRREMERERNKNMSQEQRDKINKHRRELRAKKKEAAKTNSLDVSN